MSKKIFPKELLKNAVTRAREIETEYYEWEIKNQEEHRFSRKYQKKVNELRNPKLVRYAKRNMSMKLKIALVAVIVMLMGSMTVLAVGPLREKVNNFIEELFQKEPEKSTRVPTKTEVYAKREEIFAGMTEEEIHRLRENIKALNLDFEQKYIYENCFEKRSDLNDMDTNRFIQLMAELKDSMKTDLLDTDFNNLVNNMIQAKETHEVEYLEEVYHILHDMDYYLLRYGPEDVAVYLVDPSTVLKYYGVLEVYAGEPIQDGNPEIIPAEKEYAGTFDTFDKEELLLEADFDISECYITNEVTMMNHYYIDEDGVLWGNGQNDCGQLGLDRPGDIGNLEIYYEDYVKIAENVVHVDCPLNGCFMVYLTEDGKLYGAGMNLAGLMLMEDDEKNEYSIDGEIQKVAVEPILLMEQVKYVRVGNANIVALLENGDVYWWGEYDVNGISMVYEKPMLMLKGARYVTCEDENAAVISKNNELYMWGNNEWGQCGILTEEECIAEPVKVLDDVRMVWIHFLKFNCPKGQERVAEEIYKYQYYWNTFVLMENGEFAAAGKDIGQYEVLEEVFGEFEDPGRKEKVYYSPEFLYIEVKEGDD